MTTQQQNPASEAGADATPEAIAADKAALALYKATHAAALPDDYTIHGGDGPDLQISHKPYGVITKHTTAEHVKASAHVPSAGQNREQNKVYWRDLTETDRVADCGNDEYRSHGRLICWHWYEEQQALAYLRQAHKAKPTHTKGGLKNANFVATKGESRVKLRKPFHPRLDVALDKMRHNIVPELSVSVIAEAYDETAAERDRLKEQLGQACDTLDFATSELEKAREQVKTLATMLEEVTTAAEIIDGSEKPTDSDIEHFLDCCHRSHKLLAAIESEGQ